MATKKQQREAERRRAEKFAAKVEAKQRRRDRTVRITATVAVIVLGLSGVIGVGFALAGGDDEPATQASASSTDVAQEPATSSGWGTSPEPPDPSLAEGRVWTATIATNQGDIVVELDGVNAPQATASFVALAQDDFFDQTDCHRLVTAGIYVLQCGDPSATGAGGPAYSYGPVENAPEDDLYPAGTLAMARVGGDGESMGSQFFIVYEDSTIPSDAAGGYTVFGQVTEGLSIVVDVASAGTITGESDGTPARSVIVNEVSVS